MYSFSFPSRGANTGSIPRNSAARLRERSELRQYLDACLEEPSFKQKVFTVVREIPKGRTLTYKQVAGRAGRPQACRAVGNILNTNYDSRIPCHRVVRSDGKVGGYNRGKERKSAHCEPQGLTPCGSQYTLRRAQGVNTDFWLFGSKMQKNTFSFLSLYVASKAELLQKERAW